MLIIQESKIAIKWGLKESGENKLPLNYKSQVLKESNVIIGQTLIV